MTKDRPTIEAHETELARSLSEFDITMIGVGAMIGAGIFVLTGIAAGTTGPSLMLAFALNGIVTIFTAMVYAELGSAIPEAGGGYLWVKDALGRSQSFLAGWMSWFSHAVAGALYALGFGSFAALLTERAGLQLPHVAGLGPEKWLGVAVAVAFVGINFRGASETGLAGNIVTIAKLVVIGLFVAFGLWTMLDRPTESLGHFEPFFPRGGGQVFVAMGITFIAFEGYEIIVQAGEEVKNPRRAIPRAVFNSLLIVIPVYVLVAVAAIGAVRPEAGQPTWQFLGEQGELGLALAADRFMPAGTLIILLGGLLSTISALNATTYSSTRVSFAMGRDRVLPDAFARVHERFKTPHVALAATGLIVVFMVVVVPIEDVAAAADVMFLLLFLQVNYAVIRLRGEFGDRLRYGYLMPFYPWVPIIGILTKAFLAVYLFNFSPLAWLFAGVWIAVGLGVFVAYARSRAVEQDRPRIAYEDKTARRTGRTVLAAVGNPATAPAILQVAAALARARDAELVALTVVRVPPQLPIEEGRRNPEQAEPTVAAIRDWARTTANPPVNIIVGVGRAISRTITTIADREETETIVIGWRGTVHESAVRGSVAQELLSAANSDVVVVKDRGDTDPLQKVLAGVSPGIRAEETVRLAAAVAAGADRPLSLLTVQSPTHANLDTDTLHDTLDRAHTTATETHAGLSVDTAVVTADSVLDAFRTRTDSDTLVIVGASRDWIRRGNLLGEFPDAFANSMPCNVAVIRPAESRPVSLWRQLAGRITQGRPRRSRSA